MKKRILILLTFSIVVFVLLTSCNSPDSNVGKSNSAVIEAGNDVQQAARELTNDINQYRIEATERMGTIDSAITAFKVSLANETDDVKASTEEQLALLEQKNNDLKKRLTDYKDNGKEHWETFKLQFNNDLNSLGNTFDDLTQNSL
ncbi:MAG: hypothetical protein ACQETE_09715 [Bacteroidota bacterium]